MEKFVKDILKIIVSETSSINAKVRGVNLLELLKIKLLEKIVTTVNNQTFTFEKKQEYIENINQESRQIRVSFQYFISSLAISKKIIDSDCLFLIFNEPSNIDIFTDEKNFTSILLYKNTGLTLPKDTIINSKFNKNTFLLEISYKDVE
tara:strand:- start:10497 stop:10943 length:447 start_codon:yes stop_codon:yes gene_type:complete